MTPSSRTSLFSLLWTAFALASSPALAVQACELNGESVNPANGYTTAGKTGLMRCRDADGGPVLREQELKNGVFMGVVRYFQNGLLEREFSVNERGNKDGLSREYAAKPGTPKALLLEETYRNGSTVGISRRWYPHGALRRVAFQGDGGRTEASAEFTSAGRLSELQCSTRALLGNDADDATWCGHRNGPSKVELFTEDGRLASTVSYERGERHRLERFWDNGKPQLQWERDSNGSVERSFSKEGIKRREVTWAGRNSERRTTAEREYHETGTLVHERRYTPSERGSELQAEQTWYLNGQPREKQEYASAQGVRTRHDTSFHDNGRVASEGSYVLQGRYERLATGVHKSYDGDGRLRAERYYDGKGRVTRERELDAAGQTTRDDEVFEDGSRKATAR